MIVLSKNEFLKQILETRTDKDGSFIRCLHCGGKHYYVLD